jgi:aspartyl-tRNA synthetase
MILTGARSIRDVILFPLMRPEAERQDAGPATLKTETPPPEGSGD